MVPGAQLRRDRPSVADILDIEHLVAIPQLVEAAIQDRVAVEIEKPALLGEDEAVIGLGLQFRDLPRNWFSSS